MNEDTRIALQAIARKYGVTLERIRQPGKFAALCAARKECYEFLYRERKWSTTMIGRWFNRDHSTIVYILDNTGRLEEKRARKRQLYQTIKAAGTEPLGARRVG